MVTAGLRATSRRLRATPGPSAGAAATMALGIGAAVTVFTVVYAAVLKPLPFPDADRLAVITSEFPAIHLTGRGLSGPEYLELREMSRAWTALGAVRFGTAALGAPEPQRIGVAAATYGLMEALGVPPAIGRLFRADEDRPGAAPVALMGHGLWTRAFGADPAIVGRTIEVNGRPREVLGVMPAGFDLLGAGTDVWMPLALDPEAPGSRADHNLRVVGRIDAALSIELARADLESAVSRWMTTTGQLHSPAPRFHPLTLTPLLDATIGDVRRTLRLLAGAVGLLLALACANVANLLLARGESLRHQIAIRAALGASRRRLLVEHVADGVVLSAAGGAAGVALAVVATRVIASVSLPLPRQTELGVDGPVLLFAAGLTVACGVAVGVLPVLRLDITRTAAWLRSDGRSLTAPRERRHLQRLLITSQLALAVTLLTAGGALTRSFWRLAHVETGVKSKGVLTFQVSLPQGRYRADAQVLEFYERLTGDLKTVPGVRSAAAMSGRLPERRTNNTTFLLEGVAVGGHEGMPHVDFIQHVTPGMFETLGIELIRGRLLGQSETAPVAVINETLARKFFPGSDPLGRRLRAAVPDTPWFSIVGVVRDVKQAGLASPAGTEIFVAHRQARLLMPGWLPSSMEVVVASTSGSMPSGPVIRGIVSRIDPSAAVANLRPMEEVVSRSIAGPRFLASVVAAFAAAAALLAGIGVYAVVAFSVSRRTTELGVRLALGATRRNIRALVLRQAAVPIAVGAAIGLAGARASSSLMTHLLYETRAIDSVNAAGAVAGIAVLALVASWIPARRATRLDPLDALRHT